MTVYCGIDWAERHHDVALVNEDGKLVAKKRIPDTIEGFTQLIGMLTDAGDDVQAPIPVAIETPRGLLVSALRATGRPVYAINPMAVARYRERATVSRSKSDHADAMVLANILRTDIQVHRPLPADSELAQAIAVLARAHQDATWRRTSAANELRSLLREYFPVFLAAVGGSSASLCKPEARAVLTIAPTPAAAQTLTQETIATALRQAGRSRNVANTAATLLQALGKPQLRHPAVVEHAMGIQAQRLLATLATECSSVETLTEAVTEAFQQHPDHDIIISFPGLGEVTGARVLAEIGDDRGRFVDARAVKAYAGSAPVTRASGRSISITHRRVKNHRLNAAGFIWSFMAITNHQPARLHYNKRRQHGDRHASALRHLFNRMIGQLHHCLQAGQLYDPIKAFGAPTPDAA